MLENLPIVIIGAGPVGLAAAVHVLQRGQTPLVLEAGPAVGSGPRKWGHIRMFSPWEYNVDPVAAMLLARHGWLAPDPQALPTGRELVEKYLEPLAALPQLAPKIRLGARVTGVSRENRDRMTDTRRSEAPFVVRYVRGGQEAEVLAQAVIDASGHPRLAQSGRRRRPAGDRRKRRPRADLLRHARPARRRAQAIRRAADPGAGRRPFGGRHAARRRPPAREGARHPDPLGGAPARSPQGARRRRPRSAGRARPARCGDRPAGGGGQLQRCISVSTSTISNWALKVWSPPTTSGKLPPVDELVVAAGYRPDLSLLSEIRLALDPGTQSPVRLAPLIDPNLHSCGSVPPHGADELGHPEERFYLVGMKSYGRAPTFLMRTGYEQVRSVRRRPGRRLGSRPPGRAFAAGDRSLQHLAWRRPGCGFRAVAADRRKKSRQPCCAADEDAKAAGAEGCGCGSGETVVGDDRQAGRQGRRPAADRRPPEWLRKSAQSGCSGRRSASTGASSTTPSPCCWCRCGTISRPPTRCWRELFSLGLASWALLSARMGVWLDRGRGRAMLRGGGLAAAVLLLAWSWIESPAGLYLIWAGLGGPAWPPCSAETAFGLSHPRFRRAGRPAQCPGPDHHPGRSRQHDFRAPGSRRRRQPRMATHRAAASR